MALPILALALLTTGCRSSTSIADGSADTEASTGDGPAVDASDNDCNAISQLGAAVTATCSPGSAAAALGGAIADGTYVLTETIVFGACALPDLAETLVVSQGTVQSLASGAEGTLTRKSVSYTIAAPGTLLVETQTCPTKVIANVRFTATPTTLTIYLTNALTTRVSTFTLM